MNGLRLVVLCAGLALALPALAESSQLATPPPAGNADSAQASSAGTPDTAASLQPRPSASAADRETPAGPAGEPDLRPRPPVLGMAGLRELSAEDPVVRERYEALQRRRSASIMAAVGSVLGFTTAGIAAAVAAVGDMEAQIGTAVCSGTSRSFGGGDCRKPEPNYTAAYVALGVGVALGVVTLVAMPRSSDVDSAVALWNSRHPDDRVALAGKPMPPAGGRLSSSEASRSTVTSQMPESPEPVPSAFPASSYCPVALGCPVR